MYHYILDKDHVCGCMLLRGPNWRSRSDLGRGVQDKSSNFWNSQCLFCWCVYVYFTHAHHARRDWRMERLDWIERAVPFTWVPLLCWIHATSDSWQGFVRLSCPFWRTKPRLSPWSSRCQVWKRCEIEYRRIPKKSNWGINQRFYPQNKGKHRTRSQRFHQSKWTLRSEAEKLFERVKKRCCQCDWGLRAPICAGCLSWAYK